MANLEYTNYYNGDSDVKVLTRTVPQNTTVLAGEIVDKGVNVGEIAKASGTPTSAYGIALEAAETGEGETASIAIFVNGSFNSDKVIYPQGKAIVDYEIPLRDMGIYFTNVINTELTR